jgi:hypothetical protein
MPTLTLNCPRCGNPHEDPFEVLGPDALESMRCEACREKFWFAIMECRCGREHPFSWLRQPAPTALDLLSCESCGQTIRIPDAEHEPDIPDSH